jgi:hypothetical protein
MFDQNINNSQNPSISPPVSLIRKEMLDSLNNSIKGPISQLSLNKIFPESAG